MTAKVANPRHNDGNDARNDGTGSWDDGKSAAESAQDTPNVALGVDWAKVQNLAALVGAATLGAVVTLQLTGKADLQSIAYQSIPEPLQEALPQLGGDTNKGPLPQFEVGAVVQNFQVSPGKGTCGSLVSRIVFSVHVCVQMARHQAVCPTPHLRLRHCQIMLK